MKVKKRLVLKPLRISTLILLIIFFTKETYAQKGRQTITNGSYNVQILGNGRVTYYYYYDTAFTQLRKFVKSTDSIYNISITAEFTRLRHDLKKFWTLKKQYNDSISSSLKLLNIDIADIKREQRNIANKLEDVETMNQENVLTILGEFSRLNEKTDILLEHHTVYMEKLDTLTSTITQVKQKMMEGEKRKTQRDENLARKIRNFRYDSTVYRKVFYLRMGVNTAMLTIDNTKIGILPGMATQLGVHVEPYRYERVLNPSVSFFGSMQNIYPSFNGTPYAKITLLSLALQPGISFQTQPKGKKVLSNFIFPISVIGEVVLNHKYATLFNDYNVDMFATEKSNEEIERVNRFALGISGAAYLQLIRLNKYGGIIIGPYYTLYVSDIYNRKYVDSYQNMPYQNLSSKRMDFGLTAGIIFN